ncbi:MAG: hypothetical protein ACLQVI_01915 [Polyangiaceae bacterium]
MTEPRLTPKMTAKLDAIKQAQAKLDERHLKWIVDAAIEHFSDDVAETEATIVRYTALPELPIYSRFGKDRGDDYQGAKREKEIPKLRAHVDECYAILDFLQALSDAEVIRSAEAFAAAFRASGGSFGGAPGGRTKSRGDR